MAKVLFFTAAVTPTTAEINAMTRLNLDPNVKLGVRCVLFVDTQTGLPPGGSTSGDSETLETCDGVAGAYPTVAGGYANNYDALVTAGTVKDYSAEALGGAAKLLIGGASAFAHTATTQLAAVAEGPDTTLSDVTTTVAWTSGTPATATVGASTGLVTGVAAGTTTITATQTTGGKTVTATKLLTLS